jgi:hypothetical protein
VTLHLWPYTAKDCAAPRVVIGAACVDRSSLLLASNWTLDNGVATWAPPNWRGTYVWTMPETIRPDGRWMRLYVRAEARPSRFCPQLSVRGDVEFREGSPPRGGALPVPVGVGVCAETGQPPQIAERRVTMLPPTSATSPVLVVVSQLDGAAYTYRYRVAGTTPGPSGITPRAAIGAGVPDPLPPLPAPPVEQVIVKISGNGSVTSAVTRALSASAAAPKRINCREGVYDCYTEVKPGQTLTLTATPQAGYAFRRWTGSCSGSSMTCRVVASDARTVTAEFAAKGAGAAIGATLREPRLRVRWARSIGAGNLVVQGSTTAAARARIDVRRPGGGPLATLQVPLVGGGFRQVLGMRQGSLSGGAKVFPGGFVVALTGSAGRFKLPLQVQTIAIPAPREGVVRQAFRSRRQGGANVRRFPAGVQEVWANFRFETQPTALTSKVSVRWYRPNGAVLGTVQKSNRPIISSYMRLTGGIPSGVWRAELRAANKIVSVLSVPVG